MKWTDHPFQGIVYFWTVTMHLISHVFHTEVGTVIIATNHINLFQLQEFVVIELEPDGEGFQPTIHECDGTEEAALLRANFIKKEIDDLVREAIPFDADKV